MRTELVTTLKRRATKLLDQLAADRRPILITQHGLPSAYLVDVESEARAVEIASKIVEHTGEPIEVRRLADGPPEEYTS